MNLCAFADEAGRALSEQVSALKRNAISLLELRAVGGKNIKDITSAEAKEIKRVLDGEGISVWSIGSPIGKYPLEADIAPHLDDFLRVIENAEILGAKNIRIFSFYPGANEAREEMSRRETAKKVTERLSLLCERTPNEIILCHENEKDIFGETPESCLMIHRQLPKIRAVFDPANFVQCGVDTLAAWEMLRPYVEYMHIKDATADGRVVPAGAGEGKIAQLISRYFEQGGRVLTLEPHLAEFAGFGALEKDTAKTRFVCADQGEAFDLGVSALKDILKDII